MRTSPLFALISCASLTLACGSSDATTPTQDATNDAVADAPIDAQTETTIDAIDDTSHDTFDAAVDVVDANDAGKEASDAIDAGVDSGCPDAPTTLFHVDATVATSGNGSGACPFKTISEALAAAGSTPGVTVLVAPGKYDAALGEHFPLHVLSNVDVQGDLSLATSPDSFLVEGHGVVSGTSIDATVILAGQMEVMTLSDSTSRAAQVVYVGAGSAQLRFVTVQGGIVGVRVTTPLGATTGATLSLLQKCEIESAAQDGIRVDAHSVDFAPKLTAVGALVHDNGVDGVHVQTTTSILPIVDLGTDCPAASPTYVYCNAKYGIETDPGVSVSARGVEWDHASPTSGAAPADVDDTSRVDVTCNGVAAPGACMK